MILRQREGCVQVPQNPALSPANQPICSISRGAKGVAWCSAMSWTKGRNCAPHGLPYRSRPGPSFRCRAGQQSVSPGTSDGRAADLDTTPLT